MTPLAQKIVRNAGEWRTLDSQDGQGLSSLVLRMAGVHCFEVSAICELATDLVRRDLAPQIASTDQASFLPAPKTWLERRVTGDQKGRAAIFLQEIGNGRVWVDHILYNPAQWDDEESIWYYPDDGFEIDFQTGALREPVAGWQGMDAALVPVYLSFINTPHVAEKVSHPPHKGFERQVRRTPSLSAYPLLAWTEIRLDVGRQSVQNEPTGPSGGSLARKAFHFCRKHIRVRNGRVELVKAHWRGDPSLGIKRSRYRLNAPEAA